MNIARRIKLYLFFLRLLICLFTMSFSISRTDVAFAFDQAGAVSAELYELDVQSGRMNEDPKIIGLWGMGHYLNTPFRVQVPARFFGTRKLTVHYQWSTGSLWAGQSERVELLWRQSGGTWQTELLGQGFRDPVSGQLLLFPAHIEISGDQSGTLELKFLLVLANGETIQDGGNQGLKLSYSIPSSQKNILAFRTDWKTSQTGRLVAGKTFELQYDVQRLIRQMNLQVDDPSPWSVVARVQFDERSIEEYPLLAIVSDSASQVVSYLPTIAIPPDSRRMSLWFIAFYNSQSYFDSNYGVNFNFAIDSN